MRSTVGNLALAGGAVLAALLLSELALRIAPAALLPPGSYGAGRWSEALGFNVHGRPLLYTKGGGLVVREPNADGFLDLPHDRAKPPGLVRIGFFGDSYVESAQVPIETVFFRQLENRLRPRPLETLGFGMSGWGTAHSLRAFEAFGPLYGLDVAVYVFVENDPGDQSFEIARARGLGANMPFAELALDGESYAMRWIVDPSRAPWWFRPAKWLQQNSLLAHVVRDRIVALRQGGVRVRMRASDREMTTLATGMPSPNDLPGSWPTAVRERTQRLGELVLTDWKRAADSAGSHLLVLYVPRGEAQLRGEIPREDTWLPWLEATTGGLGIPLLDAGEPLAAVLAAGVTVYTDHWTPAGHAAVADFLAARLAPMLAEPTADPTPRLR